MPVAPFELVDRPTFEDNWTFCDVEFRRLGQAIPEVVSPDGEEILAFKRVKQPVVEEAVRYVKFCSLLPGPHNLSTPLRLRFVEVDGELKEVRIG